MTIYESEKEGNEDCSNETCIILEDSVGIDA